MSPFTLSKGFSLSVLDVPKHRTGIRAEKTETWKFKEQIEKYIGR